MAAAYFYSRAGERFGPVSSQQLKQLASTGGIQPDDLIWKDGMKDWITASRVEGLFGSPPPLPTSSRSPAPATPVPSGSESADWLSTISTPKPAVQQAAPSVQKTDEWLPSITSPTRLAQGLTTPTISPNAATASEKYQQTHEEKQKTIRELRKLLPWLAILFVGQVLCVVGSVVTFVTGFLAGFVVFSILGFLFNYLFKKLNAYMERKKLGTAK